MESNMASNLWTLDDFKDFETIDKVFFSNYKDCYKNDDEGYTPLCFASLNGVTPECIAYFMWKANRNEIFNKCNINVNRIGSLNYCTNLRENNANGNI